MRGGLAPGRRGASAAVAAVRHRARHSGPSANRTALLRAAAQFSRVFQLGAPEAPGLVFFAGEVDPSMIARRSCPGAADGGRWHGTVDARRFRGVHRRGRRVSLAIRSGRRGAGRPAAAREMRQSARGEGRKFLDDLLPGAEGAARCEVRLPGGNGAAGRLQDAASGRDLSSPELWPIADEAALSAQHGLRRRSHQGRRRPAWAVRARRARRRGTLVAGRQLAAGRWPSTIRRRLRPLCCWPSCGSENAESPHVAARHHDGPRHPRYGGGLMPGGREGFAFGLGARPTVAGAARGAIMELCQSELAQAVVAAKEAESGPEKLNARDRAHIARATRIDADSLRALASLGHAGSARSLSSQDAVSQIGWLATRLAASGHRDFRDRSHAAALCRAGRPCRRARPADRALAAREPPPATGDRDHRWRVLAHRRLGIVLAARTVLIGRNRCGGRERAAGSRPR